MGLMTPCFMSKPRNRTLVWKSLIFGAETTRPFLFIVWKNVLRCFQCLSRDFEKMSTSSMYTMVWLENGLKISFMMFCNSKGAFLRPKGYIPFVMTKGCGEGCLVPIRLSDLYLPKTTLHVKFTEDHYFAKPVN